MNAGVGRHREPMSTVFLNSKDPRVQEITLKTFRRRRLENEKFASKHIEEFEERMKEDLEFATRHQNDRLVHICKE